MLGLTPRFLFQLLDVGFTAVDDLLKGVDHALVVREADDLSELLHPRLDAGDDVFPHDTRQLGAALSGGNHSLGLVARATCNHPD